MRDDLSCLTDARRWESRTPDAILLKPGRLTVDEFTIMKTHARDGYDIMRDGKSSLLRMAADIALTHHERFDGAGYPLGVRGRAIPLSGRIVALADVFDALTSKRVYKPAWTVEESLTEIQARNFAADLADPPPLHGCSRRPRERTGVT